MTRVSQSPGNPLASPLWWLALFTLLINDHVLKRAGVLPSALTGKLSDFAGLVVAPVLLVAIVRARAPWARLACFGAVAAGFTAVKLSTTAAAAVAGALTALGVPSRIIADPTDLMALAILPAAWLLARPRPAPVETGPARTFVGRAGLVLGMIACVATSKATPANTSWQTPAYLLNSTGAGIDVRIRYYDGELDCEALGDRPARALAPSAFGEGVRFHLNAGQTVPLSQPDVLAATGATFDIFEDQISPPCEVVLIQSDGMASTIVWWSDLFDLSVPETIGPTDLEDNAILLNGLVTVLVDGGATKAVARGKVNADVAKESVEPSSCPAQAESMQWSQVPYGDGYIKITAIDTLPDGCLDLALEQTDGFGGGSGGMGGAGGAGGSGGGGAGPGGSAAHVVLCVPPNVFPFKAGDVVELITSTGEGRALEMYGPTTSFIARSGQTSPSYPLPNNMQLNPLDCEGDRMACGGFSVPVELKPFTSVAIKPGQESIIDTSSGTKARVILGRAEQVLAAREDCEPGRDTLNTHMDYVVVIEEGGM